MAVTVDRGSWPYLITIPQSDLTLDSGTRYTITVDKLWELLRDFSDSSENAGYPTLYRRIPSTASTPAITEFNDPSYTAEFEDGAYSVDIINGNTNFRDVEEKNTVSVGTNNTTGFIDPTFLELSLFGGSVAIDSVNGVSGTGKTASGEIIGTRQLPSNNIADAKAIADERGLNSFTLIADLTVSTVDLSSGYHFIGDSPFIVLTIDGSANVSNCSADTLTVSGELDGFNTLRNSAIGAITNVSGFLEKVAFQSTVSLTGKTALFETYSFIEGTGYPVITTGSNVLIARDHHGSLGIAGMTGGNHSIGVYGGRLVIDSGTGGTIYARGEPYEIINNSVGVTIVDQTTKQVTRDAMGLTSTSGQPDIDTKLNNANALSAANL